MTGFREEQGSANAAGCGPESTPQWRRTFLLWAVFLLVVIATISALPTEYKFQLHTQGVLHPWLHVLAFATITFLFVSGLRSPVLRAAIIVMMLAFGWGSEFAEHLRDTWPVESRDVWLDALGTVAGGISALLRPNQSCKP